ncbi:MAG: 4-(cytidine 5'-diphospho)-2-C-methyl-D-erythritol kinase [Chitinophagales bacterium]|nr:4-(cytidine 5'-diphospho)-2-C-methyl-D-erythritol kinase [Chitinophagales bacterium]
MIVFPNAKINLGLHVVKKRPDGYHDLETIFFPIPLCDALEVITRKEQDSSGIAFHLSGPVNPGPDADNICVKAWHLLKNDHPGLPSASIYLHKAIPTGAGLGGGSADGAFMLSLLNQKYQLGLTEEQLLSYALQLGSDCPFFIRNKPCYATGRGEIMEPVSLSLKGYQLVLVNPGIEVSTARAFSTLQPSPSPKDLRTIIQQPITTWRKELGNDFERSVFEAHPLIGELKDQLYEQGAIYASMSGSGSTVFGLFENHGFDIGGVSDAFFTKVIEL